MTGRRSIQALITALLLLVALTSSARAEVFDPELFPATLTGSVGEAATFGAESLSVKCTSAAYSGEIPEPVETLEVSVSYSGCTGGGLAATVAMEGCKWRLYANTSAVDLVCPGENMVKITAVAGNCEVRIGPQTSLSSVEYSNVESSPETVAAKFALKSIAYTKTKDGFLCPLSGTGGKSDGTLTKGAILGAAIAGVPKFLRRWKGTPTKLCEESTPFCPAEKTYGAIEIKGESTGGEFIFSPTYSFSCENNYLTTVTTAGTGTPLVPVKGSSISLTGCKSSNKADCDGSLATSQPEGILGYRNQKDGEINPTELFAVSHCAEANRGECRYKGSGRIKIRGDSNEKATVEVDRQLAYYAGFPAVNNCPLTVTVKAVFVIYSPEDLFITN